MKIKTLQEWTSAYENDINWLFNYEPLKNELSTSWQNGEYIYAASRAIVSAYAHMAFGGVYLGFASAVLTSRMLEGVIVVGKTGLDQIASVPNQLYTSVGKPLYNEIEKSCNDKNHFAHTLLMYATTKCWFLRETPQEIINEEISFNIPSAIDITKYSLGMLGEHFTTETDAQDIL
jgi:hypothetical protein